MTQFLIKHKGKLPLHDRHESTLSIIARCSDTLLGFDLQMFSSIALVPEAARL